MAKRKLLGEILVEQRALTEEQLAQGLKVAADTGQRLGEALRSMEIISPTQLVKALAVQQGVEFVDLADDPPSEEWVGKLDEELSRRLRAVVIGQAKSDRVKIAIADPLDIVAVDRLRSELKSDIQLAIAVEQQIIDVIDSVYKLDDVVTETLEEFELDDEVEQQAAVTEPPAPIVKLVSTIIDQAARRRASDIHIDPGEDKARVRYRVDGVLSDFMTIPARVVPAVVSRLKIMGGMDIGERRLPLDGRCTVNTGRGAVDLRIATVPSILGEKTTIRLLDKSVGIKDLSGIGISGDDLERFRHMVGQPYGMFLVTGPTGSGKTTTLYAALNELNDPGKNIITMEDPVEYNLNGITQIQVNRKAGLLFSTGLRSILRMDPDIILVGEIRDAETAEIGIQSALTGHMVLSTLHTNDAPGALTRLTEMGIEPFLVASSVIGIAAQRLVRSLCSYCKRQAEQEVVSYSIAEIIGRIDEPTWFERTGCNRCNGTGYSGRMGLFEVLIVSDETRQAVLERQSSEQIGALARSQGMKTLLEAGIRAAARGDTTIEEVLRVVRLEKGDTSDDGPTT